MLLYAACKSLRQSFGSRESRPGRQNDGPTLPRAGALYHDSHLVNTQTRMRTHTQVRARGAGESSRGCSLSNSLSFRFPSLLEFLKPPSRSLQSVLRSFAASSDKLCVVCLGA